MATEIKRHQEKGVPIADFVLKYNNPFTSKIYISIEFTYRLAFLIFKALDI